MKFSKLILAFGIFALAVASAATNYTVTLLTPTWVGQTLLKPGDYKVSVEGDKAVFKDGKSTVVESPAVVQQNAKKYSLTSLDTAGVKLQEIHVGGTTVRIVLKDSGNSTPAGNQ